MAQSVLKRFLAPHIGHVYVSMFCTGQDEDERVELRDEEEMEASEANVVAAHHRKTLFATKWYEILARLMIVLSTGLVAVFAGKSFGLFQSLIGSLGNVLSRHRHPLLLPYLCRTLPLPLTGCGLDSLRSSLAHHVLKRCPCSRGIVEVQVRLCWRTPVPPTCTWLHSKAS